MDTENRLVASKYDELNESIVSLTSCFENFQNKMVDVLLSIDGSLITMLDNPTEDQYMRVVQQNGLLIEHIPEDKRTMPIIGAAIKNNSEVIKLLNIDNIHFGCRIIDLDVNNVKLMTSNNVPDTTILRRLQEYAITFKPSIVQELMLVDWSSWILAINKEPTLIDRMSSDVFMSISNKLISANAHAVATSEDAPRWLTDDQIDKIVEIVPYDTDDLLYKRFEDHHNQTFADIEKGRLWRKAFMAAPSMLKYVENFVSCPEEDKFYIDLMDKMGVVVVENLPGSVLKHRDIEFAIISRYSKERLTKIGYKPSRLINKIRLLLK